MPTELDRIEAELTKKKRKPCVLGKWISSHSDEDQARINGWLANEAYSRKTLIALLCDEEHADVSPVTFDRHRKGECRC